MNKYSEQQIEEHLNRLASIEPDEACEQRMHQRVRRLIVGVETKPAPSHGWICYIAASAAILLIAMSILYHSTPVVQESSKAVYMAQPTPSLAALNRAVHQGGQVALDQYLDKIESNRQPRAEPLTLHDWMKEL